VGDGDGRHARRLQDASHLLAHPGAEPHVQIRERLVQQEYVRFGRERPGQRHPLALPSRKVLGRAVAVVAEPDQREQLLHAGLPVRVGPVVDPERDVLGDREVWKQGELLKHHPDIAVLRRDERRVFCRAGGDGVAGNPDRPAGWSVEPGDQPEGRRLPAARRPQQRQQLPLPDRQVDRLDGRLGAVLPANVGEFQHRRCVRVAVAPRRSVAADRPVVTDRSRVDGLAAAVGRLSCRGSGVVCHRLRVWSVWSVGVCVGVVLDRGRVEVVGSCRFVVEVVGSCRFVVEVVGSCRFVIEIVGSCRFVVECRERVGPQVFSPRRITNIETLEMATSTSAGNAARP